MNFQRRHIIVTILLILGTWKLLRALINRIYKQRLNIDVKIFTKLKMKLILEELHT